jgi:hypothetical protein
VGTISAVGAHVIAQGGIHWGAIAVGLAATATAMFTITFAFVAWRNHLHDLAVSGTRRPVIAKRTRSTWAYDGRVRDVPEADRESTRVTAVRLNNRSLPEETVAFQRAHLWFGPKVTVHPTTTTVKNGHPQTLMVRLKAHSWPERDRYRGTLTFDTANGEEFKLRGRLRVWKL